MSFPTKTIREVTETLIDYRGKTPSKTASGIKLITAKVIKDGFIVDGDHEYIAAEQYDSWMRRGLPQQWDILITTEAPLGEVAQLRTPEKVALAQRVILLRGNSPIIDQAYYFHALKSPVVQQGLKARSSGTTVLGIKQSELWNVEVPCPPLKAQRRIASILSAYDDLIENNTRRIEILEEMAQRIYREWFVNLRFPGHEKTKLVESKMGRIPAKWRVGVLEDALVLQRGFDLPSSQRQPGRVPIYAATGINGYHNLAKVKGPGVITGRSGSLGTVMLIFEDFWPLNTTLWVKEFRQSNAAHSFFLLSDLKLTGFNSGAAVPTLNRNDIHGLPCLLPDRDTLDALNECVLPVFHLRRILEQQTALLQKTRDLLLPKLVSGEVSVEELETETANQIS